MNPLIQLLDAYEFTLTQLNWQPFEGMNPDELQSVWLRLRDIREMQRTLMDKIVKIKTDKLFPDGHIRLVIESIQSEERVNVT